VLRSVISLAAVSWPQPYQTLSRQAPVSLSGFGRRCVDVGTTASPAAASAGPRRSLGASPL